MRNVCAGSHPPFPPLTSYLVVPSMTTCVLLLGNATRLSSVPRSPSSLPPSRSHPPPSPPSPLLRELPSLTTIIILGSSVNDHLCIIVRKRHKAILTPQRQCKSLGLSLTVSIINDHDRYTLSCGVTAQRPQTGRLQRNIVSASS